jgi:hypothetical protein
MLLPDSEQWGQSADVKLHFSIEAGHRRIRDRGYVFIPTSLRLGRPIVRMRPAAANKKPKCCAAAECLDAGIIMDGEHFGDRRRIGVSAAEVAEQQRRPSFAGVQRRGQGDTVQRAYAKRAGDRQ